MMHETRDLILRPFMILIVVVVSVCVNYTLARAVRRPVNVMAMLSQLAFLSHPTYDAVYIRLTEQQERLCLEEN